MLLSHPLFKQMEKSRIDPLLFYGIMAKYQDYLVCGVSTQLKQYINNFDEIISPNDSDFAASGLAKQSVIRLGFLAIIPNKQIIGSIGSISSTRHHKLLQNLSDYLIKNAKSNR